MPAPQPVANRLRGTLRRVQAGGRALAAYYLDQAGQDVYLIKGHSPDAAGRPDSLEGQSLALLTRFVDLVVDIQYSARQTTPEGTILWGVELKVVGSAAGLGETAGDSVPPNEVRMGFTEEQPESDRVRPKPCVPPPNGVCLG